MQGIYYALSSSACCYCGGGGRVYVHTATSPLGPYTLQSGSIDFGTGNLTTQGQQTTVTTVAYVLLQLDLLSVINRSYVS